MSNPGREGCWEHAESERPWSPPLVQCRAPGGSLPFSNPLPNHSEFSRAKADPAGAASPRRCRQLSSCGKCSKIHLTAFWELSNFQPDCICATLTPFFLHRQRFSPLIVIIWIGIPPLQCLEILSRKVISYISCPYRNFGKQDQSNSKGPGGRIHL